MMKQNRKQNTKLKANTKGAAMTEYGILVALIGVVAIASVGNLGDRVTKTFQDLTSATQGVATGNVFTQGSGEGAGAVGDVTEAPDEAVEIASECYDPANVGTVGTWSGCDGMLIVNNSMLRGAGSSSGAGGDGSFTIAPDDAYAPSGFSDTFTFGESEYNIFTGQVTDMSSLFRVISSFNDDIGYWDTSSVTNMSRMFEEAFAFNQDISGWDVSNVSGLGFDEMFWGASSFNQNIGYWDVSSATEFYGMFYDAAAFNNGGSPSIEGWNTSASTGFLDMFNGASSFNQPIGSWDTSGIGNFRPLTGMFVNATSFNQDISGWCVSNVLTIPTASFPVGQRWDEGSGFEGITAIQPQWGTCPGS